MYGRPPTYVIISQKSRRNRRGLSERGITWNQTKDNCKPGTIIVRYTTLVGISNRISENGNRVAIVLQSDSNPGSLPRQYEDARHIGASFYIIQPVIYETEIVLYSDIKN